MDCPACKRPLGHRTVADVGVDVCASCAGVWFDAGELPKFDEPHEAEGQALLDLPRSEPGTVDRDARYSCPTGDGAVLMRHFFSAKREVEVDECPSCGGYWLDAGELHRIRAEYPTEDARTQAALELLDEVFGAKMLAAGAESQADLAKARRVANLLRFICPSYYLPGKQAGGAF